MGGPRRTGSVGSAGSVAPAGLAGDFGAGFADAGILLPVAIALIAFNGLNPTTVFVGTGLMYLVSGLYFRLPVAVQPLKAMAAIALATGASAAMLGMAGVLMGVCLLVLSLPGPLAMVRRLFPKPIIRGVQLGVGLLLLAKAARMGIDAGTGVGSLLVAVSILAAWFMARRYGWAWLVPLFLIMAAVWHGVWADMSVPTLVAGPMMPTALGLDLSPQLMAAAFFTLVIPQLPLTLGNAVMAASQSAHDYFGPDRARRVSPKALCRSLGVGNIALGLCGGMPVCHGAGGMTAHVKLGARTGRATVLFGVVLIACGLLAGQSLVPLIHLIPVSALAALLIPVGWAHAALARDVLDQPRELVVAATVAAVGLVSGNLLFGVVAGWGVSSFSQQEWTGGLPTLVRGVICAQESSD